MTLLTKFRIYGILSRKYIYFMSLKIVIADPLNVLTSTKFVVENSKLVEIDENKIDNISQIIAKRLEQGIEVYGDDFKSNKGLEEDIQLAFVLDTVNFCFWAEKEKPKWETIYPFGNIPTGGWYSLVNCFKRVLKSS